MAEKARRRQASSAATTASGTTKAAASNFADSAIPANAPASQRLFDSPRTRYSTIADKAAHNSRVQKLSTKREPLTRYVTGVERKREAARNDASRPAN